MAGLTPGQTNTTLTTKKTQRALSIAHTNQQAPPEQGYPAALCPPTGSLAPSWAAQEAKGADLRLDNYLQPKAEVSTLTKAPEAGREGRKGLSCPGPP